MAQEAQAFNHLKTRAKYFTECRRIPPDRLSPSTMQHVWRCGTLHSPFVILVHSPSTLFSISISSRVSMIIPLYLAGMRISPSPTRLYEVTWHMLLVAGRLASLVA